MGTRSEKPDARSRIRGIAAGCGLALLQLFLPGVASTAVAADGKTVRLGYFESGRMYSGASIGGEKSGYCYDYMREVADRAGWNYEFVYGSFAELYGKLKKGEIDVLPYTNQNESRRREVLFSKELLIEDEYYIAVDPQSISDLSGIGAALNGRTIATVVGWDHNSLLEAFIGKNHLRLEPRYYPEITECWAALRGGQVDATILTSLSYCDDQWACVCSIGKRPTYIAVSRGRTDLLAELDAAMEAMDQSLPPVRDTLARKYFFDNPMSRMIEEHRFLRPIVVAELVSGLFLLIVMVLIFGTKDRFPTSGWMKALAVLNLVWLVSDVLSYSIYVVKWPVPVSYLILYMAYAFGNVGLIASAGFSCAYIRGITPIGKWAFRIPAALAALAMTIVSVAFFSGEIIGFVSGQPYDFGEIPLPASIIQIFILSVYLPGLAFLKRKSVGWSTVLLLTVYGIFPVVTIVLATITGSDYSVASGVLALVFVAYQLHRNQAERQLKVLAALSNQCVSVFDVDLQTGLYYTVKQPVTTTAMNREDRRWDLAIGRDFAAECLEDSRETVRKISDVAFLRRELDGADHREYTYRHRQEVGGNLHRRCTVIALERDAVGGATRALVNFMAVDDAAVKLHQRLQEVHAIERANKAKSYFFSTVSHDIRTPLNAIIGYAELLKLGIRDEEERQKAVNSVLVSGHTLLELINDVLDLSKLEAGKMEILPEPVDVLRLVHEVADAFRATIGSKPVEIRVEVKPMPWLKLDPHRVRQILFNLVGNAVKFTEQGYVAISADYERTSAGRGTFRFAVSDTGCGITEEDQRRVALPYVQVGIEASRGKGTGLGLAICKQLVARMEGEFGLVSQLGKGSTFSVVIPGVEEENDARRVKLSTTQRIVLAVEDNPKMCRRVLVVDDVPMNRMVLKTMLKKFGIAEVEMADNGFSALKLMRETKPFDMVLTDMWMPGMDGEGLVREIRKNDAWKTLPVYAVTADVEAQKSYTGMGFSGILLKPLTFEKLREFFSSKVAR